MRPPPAEALLAALRGEAEEAILTEAFDGTILEWNPAAERIFGYAAGEVVGRNIALLLPPEADEEAALLARLRQGEPLRRLHTKRRCKDGTLLNVVLRAAPVRDGAGEVVAVVKTLRPATERESLFRAATESALDAIVAADASGRISYLNPAAQRLFGHGAVEAVGRPLTILMPDRMQGSHLAGFARYQESGMPRILGRTVEVVGRHRDGHEFPVEVSLSTWTAPDGQFFLGVLRDVSERRRAEAEREAAQRREDELARLAEMNRFKSLFINTAAHELLNPLTPMKAILHVLRRAQQPIPPDKLERSLDLLARNLDRLNRLVGDLLDASRIEARRLGLRKRRTDLAALVGDAAESFQPAASAKGVQLTLEQAAALHAEVDPERIAQVLANLVSNAIKFTPAGGRVTLALRPVAGGAQVEVRDTGIGFDAEAAAKLFQPFSRAHLSSENIEPGTGLGLYVSKGIIELHGGTVACASPGPGKGATFTVFLPS